MTHVVIKTNVEDSAKVFASLFEVVHATIKFTPENDYGWFTVGPIANHNVLTNVINLANETSEIEKYTVVEGE
ncbi:hypothetical protein FDI40_gp087 [Agrobacterium phage Atu_ph07]|uniref:Uncharacterized protein n=1 Tax=Agrobacterium phage Atu_ph07 TaxID=2024264 RepID=A0A2L0UZC7_9CAUD|nr:hypothetical protein FDI40_gp087 [Agrobacterium phage Atu_ph07]AUZ94894.1 hypothetical protein [Agrobacterium phage Atu_ph07]